MSLIRPRSWLLRLLATRVLSGPFRGMRLDPFLSTGVIMPRVLGTYEQEVSSALISLVATAGRKLVINVGAGDGYYATGLLYAGHTPRVIAFEANRDSSLAVARNAQLNDLHKRLSLRGFCDSDALRQALTEATESVILMDVEGGENELLNPTSVPELRSSDVLVEIHPWTMPELPAVVSERLAATHRVSATIPSRRPSWRDIKPRAFRLLAATTSRLEHRILQERSRETTWLVLTRR